MQICHSLRCKQIDMSTADWLISISGNNTATALSTLQGNAVTLELKLTSFTLNWLTLSGNYDKSINVGFYPK